MNSQKHDSRSGLEFKVTSKKKANVNTMPTTPEVSPMRHDSSSSQYSNLPYTPENEFETISIYQDYLNTPQSPTTASTYTQLLETDVTPQDSKKLFKYLPTHLNEAAQLKQLIYWSGQETMKNEKPTLNKEMMAAKISADKLKKLFFDSLVNGRIPSYWFTPPVTTHFKQRPNPRNERNLEKIRSLQAAIEDLEKEEEEWKKAMSRVNMFHASSVNTEEKDKELEFGDNYLRELDEDLAARVKEALQPVNDMMIDNDIKDTLFKIKATCQSLEIINEFQSRASKAIDRFHISAARKLRAADNQHENMVKTDYFKTPEESRKELDDEIGRAHV